MNNGTLSRREFTLEWAMMVLSGVIITVTGCSDTSPSSPSPAPAPAPSPPPAAPTPGAVQGSVSANHGHIATITAAELAGGSDIILQIQGDADHDHSVMLAASDLSQIAGGERVSRESSNDQAHTHFVTFN